MISHWPRVDSISCCRSDFLPEGMGPVFTPGSGRPPPSISYTWPGPVENTCTRDQDLVRKLLHVTKTWWEHFYMWPGPSENTSTRDQELVRTLLHVTRTWWEHFYTWPGPGEYTSTRDQDLVSTLLHVTRIWWEHFYTRPGPGEYTSTRDLPMSYSHPWGCVKCGKNIAFCIKVIISDLVLAQPRSFRSDSSSLSSPPTTWHLQLFI